MTRTWVLAIPFVVMMTATGRAGDATVHRPSIEFTTCYSAAAIIDYTKRTEWGAEAKDKVRAELGCEFDYRAFVILENGQALYFGDYVYRVELIRVLMTAKEGPLAAPRDMYLMRYWRGSPAGA